MKKRIVIVSSVLIGVLAIVMLLIPREDPETIVKRSWQTPGNADWGNVQVIGVDRLPGYVAVHVKYQAKPDFEPPDRWIVKDRTPLGGTDWGGHVYLVKRGLYSWEIVQ